MAFVSFEDRQGMIETVIFPQVWEHLRSRLWLGMAFLLVGTVAEHWETFTLEIQGIQSLNRSTGTLAPPPSQPRAVPVSLSS